MSNLTKRDIVISISNEMGLVQNDVQKVIDCILQYLTEGLVNGQAVEFRNFGRFEVKIRKKRMGRNPLRPNLDVPIPARAGVRFKAGKLLKARVMQLYESGVLANK